MPSTSHSDAPQLALFPSLSLHPVSPRLAEVESDSPALPANQESAQAERRYRRLLARKERMGDLSGMAACYIQLGDVFLARGDSEQAGDMYRKSLKLARSASVAQKSLLPDELL